MPIDKYLILRRAAEMDEITRRLTVISDINAAFSGNKKYIDKLEKMFNEVSGQKEVTWKKDSNWKERLMRFKR